MPDMPTAEIITIGTEILLGEITDTNAPYIARSLRDIGVDLFRKTTVGDNARRIAQVIRDALDRSDIIITTGGLGPTIDDATREGAALAVGVETEFQPELWGQIQNRFERFGRIPTENNKRQAYIPKGAIPVENPVGTAPAFIVETGKRAICALPGVPHEMEYLFDHAIAPYLNQRFGLKGIIKTRLLHTAGAGESQIDDLIQDLEKMHNPTVGLSAHAGQVDVRIAAKADSLEEAERLIDEIDAVVRNRLGGWIYGTDGDTLEGAALNTLSGHGWKLAVLEAGLSGNLTQRLASFPGPFLGGEVLADLPSPQRLPELAIDYQNQKEAQVILGAALFPGKEKQELHVFLKTPCKEHSSTHTYGGPPALAPTWAANLCLNYLRKLKANIE
jgi:nicotinamide-nucleotide amidase